MHKIKYSEIILERFVLNTRLNRCMFSVAMFHVEGASLVKGVLQVA